MELGSLLFMISVQLRKRLNWLRALKKMEFDIKDTALGRMVKIEKRKMDAVIDQMDKEERDNLRRKLEELDHRVGGSLIGYLCYYALYVFKQ